MKSNNGLQHRDICPWISFPSFLSFFLSFVFFFGGGGGGGEGECEAAGDVGEGEIRVLLWTAVLHVQA